MIEIRNDIIFIFTLLYGTSERFHLFEALESSVKIYVIIHHYSIRTKRVKIVFVELLTYTVSISVTIEIHKKKIDTFRVTNKRYYKIIFFWELLSNKTDIFRELMPNSTDVFQKNVTRRYFFLSQMWTYILNPY